MALTYYRRVRTTAKGRWFNKTVAEVAEEFGASARLLSDPEHVITPQDYIEYELHVHEPPVPRLNFSDAILYDCSDFIVVNKPSGIPVHPTVNYYHNTITEMLAQHYKQSFYPCYRLDRLTSGVLVLAKTAEFVVKFKNLPKAKEYLARVESKSLPQTLKDGGRMTMTDPIINFNAKRGYARFLDAMRTAKPAVTHVELVSSDGKYSTLRVEPETGRTHQIRKHLAIHGMPIHNDELYFDGGRFRSLFLSPTEENFQKLWDYAEHRRLAKLTGDKCGCGQLMYHRNVPKLDLHCAMYKFGDFEFRAALPENKGPD